ncbi:hypothetical protein AAHE18_07G088200 [Arachis hypogaea]
MPALTEMIRYDGSVEELCPFRWGQAPGAVVNRVALEACVQARLLRSVLVRIAEGAPRSHWDWMD